MLPAASASGRQLHLLQQQQHPRALLELPWLHSRLGPVRQPQPQPQRRTLLLGAPRATLKPRLALHSSIPEAPSSGAAKMQGGRQVQSPGRVPAQQPSRLSSRLAVNSATVVAAAASVVSAEGSPASQPPTAAPDGLPLKRTVAGCGGAGVDYLASVLGYPKPDDKIRTTELQVQGGGNVGNALTAASRLGLATRIFTKVADDSLGKGIVTELQDDGVDTSHIIIGHGGVSPFTYIIVDQETSTRTCIHTPGSPPLASEELSDEAIESFLDGADIAYFDARLAPCAIRMARRAVEKQVPVLLDAEKPRDGLDELLGMSDYVICSENFPETWTGAPTLGSALLQMLERLPQLAFVVVTRGAAGCVMLDRRASPLGLAKRSPLCPASPASAAGTADAADAADAADVDAAIASLVEESRVAATGTQPVCSERACSTYKAECLGEKTPTIEAVLAVSTARKLKPEQVVDTTGAGDAFIGAVLYGLCAGLPRSKLLPLGATVAASKCLKLGARPGLPRLQDSLLAEFL